MPRDIVTLNLKRNSPEESWGFTIVGGEDIARILKVDRVHGIGSPAGKGNLQPNDAIKYVDDQDVTEMTHTQIVQLFKNYRGLNLTMVVERGEHVIPSISDAFPLEKEMSEEDKLAYYEMAMKKGLGGFIMGDSFTTIGKFKVKTPKYNCPKDLYSEQTMDDMVAGSGSVDPDKLAPDGPAMAKYRKAKRFDPTKSDVLQVLNEQEKGEYCVDKKAVIEARLDQQCNGVS